MKENYTKFGYDILGPFLHGFVSWLRDQTTGKGIDKVFFLSRDGHLMMRAYEALLGKNMSQSCRYVYFSRNSIRRSLLCNCRTYEESLKYYSKCRYTTLSEVSAYYGLTYDQVISVIPEVGDIWTDSIEYSSLSSNITVRNLYDRFEDYIRDNSRCQCELLKGYLKQEGMTGVCAIVDIGWHGSMQYFLEEFVIVNNIDAVFHGYYVGHNPVVDLNGTANGWLYDSDSSSMRKKVLCFFGVIEKLFQSQEGSTYSYEEKEGMVYPCFEKYEFEGEYENAEMLQEIQDGALEYIQKNRIKVDKCAWRKMIKFGTSPSLAQARLFMFLCNKDGAKTYFLPQKCLFSYKPMEFVHALSNSAWKTGFMKIAFKLPLPYYMIYKIIRK